MIDLEDIRDRLDYILNDCKISQVSEELRTLYEEVDTQLEEDNIDNYEQADYLLAEVNKTDFKKLKPTHVLKKCRGLKIFFEKSLGEEDPETYAEASEKIAKAAFGNHNYYVDETDFSGNEVEIYLA